MSDLRPGVQFVREFAPRKTTPAVDTRTTFMVGLTKSGPTDKPVLVRSYAEFEATFGGEHGHAKMLPAAVALFFQHGNAALWIGKVADTENNGNPNDAAWQAAIDLFSADLGPGQVLAPGSGSARRHKQLANHALATNRVALLDGEKGADANALKSLAQGLKSAAGAPRCALFGNWVTLGDKDIPASVIAAIQCTKIEALANIQPIEQQVSPIAGVAVPKWTDANKAQAFTDGANLVVGRPQGAVLGGFRGAVESDGAYDFAATRLMMWLEASINAIAGQYIGAPITTDTVAAFHGAVSSLLARVFAAGGLYGETAQDAYQVDTRSVNTPESAARRELNARILIRIAEHVERVAVYAVSVPVTETI